MRSTGTVRDPARPRLLETRKAVIANWNATADLLDAQVESTLASEVRYFARHLPPVLTDRERLATQFLRHLATKEPIESTTKRNIRDARVPGSGVRGLFRSGLYSSGTVGETRPKAAEL